MAKRTALVLFLAALGTLVVFSGNFHPRAEEMQESEPSTVSESDLQVYIDVYRRMQSDHDLTIENAIRTHHISLEDFRALERRIQNESRLVERVREALLEHAKHHSAYAQEMLPTATPARGQTPKTQ